MSWAKANAESSKKLKINVNLLISIEFGGKNNKKIQDLGFKIQKFKIPFCKKQTLLPCYFPKTAIFAAEKKHVAMKATAIKRDCKSPHSTLARIANSLERIIRRGK